ncbi:MAG: ATP-binding protein [Bacteroidetes bacterium SW_9_63_38]|nr:MAG: ATP-binding protein [Bacteroidetes bacterium SW_9_63_38]
MSVLAKKYSDLDHALDEVRSVLHDWSRNLNDASVPRGETIHYTQLVLHEWIANLLQHADFADRPPSIEIRLTTQNRHITCSVIDNSEGFDLKKRLPEREEMEELPERGMGLRIIDACTGELSYTSTGAGTYCFKFFIPADHDPWLSMLF